MNIPGNQVSYRKRIGTSGRRAIYGIGTIGGLHLVAAERASGGLETLGAGSHPGIARHIAKKYAPDVEFDEMAKSERLAYADFADLVPGYEELTAQIRSAQGY